MGEYSTYSAYKPSNVAWLGDIPDHWTVWKITHGFNRIGSGTTPRSDNPVFYDGDIPWVTTSELRETVIFDTTQKVTAEAVASHSALKIYPKGSLAIAMYGATIGRLGILGIDATFNQACCVFADPRVFDTRFVYYWLWMRRPILISLSNGGGQPNLSQDDLKKLWIPIPDIPEQQVIVRFLDFKTAQIDALIAKKKALLDKLAEKRTALISHAVTKGLDPSVPMKPSGAEWLGDVPKHWEAKRLKFVINEPLKYGANEAAELTDPDLPRYIRITDVNEDGTLREETFRSLPEDIADDYLLSDGDILLARSGATVGKSFIYKPSWGVAAYAGYLIRARMSKSMNADFAYLFFQSSCYWQWLNSVFIQATIQNVSAEKYANLVMPVPPINEQLSVVSYLLHETKKIDALRDRVDLAIKHLIEYRAALITNAVTGKIDVRDFVAPTIRTE